MARQQQVSDAAQSVKVSPHVNVRSTQRQLRSHVCWSYGSYAHPGHLRFIAIVLRLDQTEVQDLHIVIFVSHAAQENVLALDIAMDHAVTVGVCERLANLPENV